MVYDMIILGVGTVGLAASIYAARFSLSTLVIGEQVGGTINETDAVENYPGFVNINGVELGKRFEEHARAAGAEIKLEHINEVKKKGDSFAVITDKGAYEGSTVLFALGAHHRKLGVPGEEEFASKGVSYCPTCDAAFFKGRKVAVVGGGDGAAYAASILSRFAEKVYVLVRGDKMRAEPANRKRIEKAGNVEIIYNTNCTEILGDKTVNRIKLDKPYNNNEFLAVDGVFIMIGAIPNSELAEKIGVKLNKRREILINENSETNVAGVYAAGDAADKQFKQVITGAAEGVRAAFMAYKFLGK